MLGHPSKNPAIMVLLLLFFNSFQKKIITGDKLFIAADDLLPDLLVFNHILKLF
jgi:hypothetical protein